METATKKKEKLFIDDELLRRVNKPDASKEDVAKLKKMLAEIPVTAKIAGDLAHRTQVKMIEQVSSVPLVTESTKVYIEQMKEELGWEDASMLEKLIIETIVTCWLHYHNSTMQLSFATNRSHSIREGEYLDKRVSLAQKRFTRAIESLAKVRKLLKTTPANMVVDYDYSIGFSSNTGVME